MPLIISYACGKHPITNCFMGTSFVVRSLGGVAPSPLLTQDLIHHPGKQEIDKVDSA